MNWVPLYLSISICISAASTSVVSFREQLDFLLGREKDNGFTLFPPISGYFRDRLERIRSLDQVVGDDRRKSSLYPVAEKVWERPEDPQILMLVGLAESSEVDMSDVLRYWDSILIQFGESLEKLYNLEQYICFNPIAQISGNVCKMHKLVGTVLVKAARSSARPEEVVSTDWFSVLRDIAHLIGYLDFRKEWKFLSIHPDIFTMVETTVTGDVGREIAVAVERTIQVLEATRGRSSMLWWLLRDANPFFTSSWPTHVRWAVPVPIQFPRFTHDEAGSHFAVYVNAKIDHAQDWIALFGLNPSFEFPAHLFWVPFDYSSSLQDSDLFVHEVVFTGYQQTIFVECVGGTTRFAAFYLFIDNVDDFPWIGTGVERIPTQEIKSSRDKLMRASLRRCMQLKARWDLAYASEIRLVSDDFQRSQLANGWTYGRAGVLFVENALTLLPNQYQLQL